MPTHCRVFIHTSEHYKWVVKMSPKLRPTLPCGREAYSVYMTITVGIVCALEY